VDSVHGRTFVHAAFPAEWIALILRPTLRRGDEEPAVVVDVMRAGVREARSTLGQGERDGRPRKLARQRDRVAELDTEDVYEVRAKAGVVGAVVREHVPAPEGIPDELSL